MKKIILLAFLLMTSSVFAVTIDRNMPAQVDPSSAFTVSFTINPEGSLNAFDMSDFVPNGWTLNDWSVSGYTKSDVTYDSKIMDYQGKTRNGLHWKFGQAFSSPVTLSYTMTAPATTGTYELIALWVYSGGFNSKTANLNVATVMPTPTPSPTPTPPTPPSPVCGNKIVESGEECDGTSVAGQTCVSKGFASGTLKCTNCKFDTSGCVSASKPADSTLPLVAVVVVLIILAAGYFFLKKPKTKNRESIV